MHWLELALRSLANRRLSVALTSLSVAISVALLLSVEQVRRDARAHFVASIAGTDLIVGARAGPINLLLYSVFHLGDASNDFSWNSFRAIAAHEAVAWAVPIALGDSHRGYRVLGTSGDYFSRIRTGRDRALRFSAGGPFKALFEVVIGSEVAAALGYGLGRELIIAHGSGEVSFSQHDDLPFTVSGVLAPTGTPIDRSLLISLAAIEAIHVGWESGVRNPAHASFNPDNAPPEPSRVTAAMIGLHSRLKTFALQRWVNDYPAEALQAILPGATLLSLWRRLGVLEHTLFAIAALVVLSALLGMLTSLLAGLNERRREMALLRALGAPARGLFGLLCSEAALISALGVIGGLLLHWLAALLIAPWLLAHFGVAIAPSWPSPASAALLLALVVLGAVIGALPAWQAYRRALSDGLSLRN